MWYHDTMLGMFLTFGYFQLYQPIIMLIFRDSTMFCLHYVSQFLIGRKELIILGCSRYIWLNGTRIWHSHLPPYVLWLHLTILGSSTPLCLLAVFCYSFLLNSTPTNLIITNQTKQQPSHIILPATLQLELCYLPDTLLLLYHSTPSETRILCPPLHACKQRRKINNQLLRKTPLKNHTHHLLFSADPPAFSLMNQLQML